jgi:hypothetical protein
MLARAAAETAEGTPTADPRLEAYKADLKLLSPEDRRKRLQAIWARDPRITAETVADLFGVSISTINQDRILMKAEASQRLANDPDVQSDLFGPYTEMRDAALADAAQVPVADPSRASHRRTALTAHEKLVDVMFRCGWIAEAPKKHEVTGAAGGPVQVENSGPSVLAIVADPEASALASALVARLSEGTPLEPDHEPEAVDEGPA